MINSSFPMKLLLKLSVLSPTYFCKLTFFNVFNKWIICQDSISLGKLIYFMLVYKYNGINLWQALEFL